MKSVKKFCVGLPLLLAVIWVGCETEGPDDFKSHFIKYYGEDGNQEAKDFVVNADGTVVMVGTSEINGIKKVYLVKADEQGKQLWSLQFAGETNETGQDVERIISGSDVGNYLVVSNLEKSVNDSLAIRLTVVSETGDSLKSFLIDRFESQEAKSITVLASGQYYLTGRVNNSDTLNAELVGLIDLEDSFDMTIANDLSIVSSERFGRSTVASGIKTIDKINSINYALFTDELIPLDAVYESNFVFRKYDKITNNKLAFYSGTNGLNEYLSDIDQSFSGIFMAIGTQVDPNDNSKRMYGTTINASYLGVLNEDNIEGGPTHGEGVAVSRSIEDGFFWVLGNEIKVGGQDRNIWVGKVDANNLQAVFSRKFGGSNNDDTGSKILQLDNGDVLILGTMEVVNQKKIVLIKIKQDGSF